MRIIPTFMVGMRVHLYGGTSSSNHADKLSEVSVEGAALLLSLFGTFSSDPVSSATSSAPVDCVLAGEEGQSELLRVRGGCWGPVLRGT